MDYTERRITKIAREANRFTKEILRDTGLGVSEYEMLRYIRKNPGVNQNWLKEKMKLDKAAIARMCLNLENKGYIVRHKDESDMRAKNLFATEKALEIKSSTTGLESFFYEWLLEDINDEEREIFIRVLDEIYHKSKKERQNGFKTLIKLEGEKNGELKTEAGKETR